MISKLEFVLFQVSDGWIVYNTNKPFKEGHTHLRNKNSALAAIDFVHKERIPKKTSIYYLISLIRISNNIEYVAKVSNLIEVRKGKGKKEACCKSNSINRR